MECPEGAGGRGRFLLQWLFWGLNQIKSAAAPLPPTNPQQLRRTAVRPPRARGDWNRASCPPPISPLLKGVLQEGKNGLWAPGRNLGSPLPRAVLRLWLRRASLCSSLRIPPGIFPGPNHACQSKSPHSHSCTSFRSLLGDLLMGWFFLL